MATAKYNVINTGTNLCTNIILWDGVSVYQPGVDLILQLSDGSILLGDEVVLISSSGAYQSITVHPAPTPPPTPTPAELFNVDTFCEALFANFAADSNLFPYYAVLKDLAVFQNFYGMNTIVNALLAANILTSDEVSTLNNILATQNIVLSTFTTP